MTENGEEQKLRDAICSVLEGKKKSSIKVKKLRKEVLISLQLDESDKAIKKQFKKAVQALEADGDLKLDEDGSVTLSAQRRKRKLTDKSQKEKKKLKVESDKHEEHWGKDKDDTDTSTDQKVEPSNIMSDLDKNKPCKGNPQGVTRLFLGNLPFSVDEASLGAFLPGEVTHIKWITDKETGKFYGSAFIEMNNSSSAAEAVAMAGSQLMGRPIKINFAPSRPGDLWPPEKRVISGGGASSSNTTGGQAGGKGVKAMSAKPDNCLKLFIGNLSYDIDDDSICKFFGSVDAEVKAVRWLHHKDSGDFKGV